MEGFLLLATAIPIVHKTGSLRKLSGRIGDMAGEEEVVPGLDPPC